MWPLESAQTHSTQFAYSLYFNLLVLNLLGIRRLECWLVGISYYLRDDFREFHMTCELTFENFILLESWLLKSSYYLRADSLEFHMTWELTFENILYYESCLRIFKFWDSRADLRECRLNHRSLEYCLFYRALLQKRPIILSFCDLRGDLWECLAAHMHDPNDARGRSISVNLLLQCFAVCCSVLQCVAVCCVCCSML